jgi:large subunit ribosomal protein L3
MEGMLGRKLGMTQIYAEDGSVVPVTVLRAGPCLVVQRKTRTTDGYESVQLGLVEDRPPKHVTKPRLGHFAKAGVAALARLMEFRLSEGEEVQPGDEVKATIFTEKQYVDVVATSKGKGFQGVVKRHGFAGGRATHGSMFHRAPGSIGASAFPSRVIKGNRSSGRLGGRQSTMKNLIVVRVDAEKNLLYLRGAVPGARRSIVKIMRSTFGKPSGKPSGK